MRRQAASKFAALDVYKRQVKAYNTRLVKFPGNVFGSMLGFEKASYFEADDSAADTPDVGDMLAE